MLVRHPILYAFPQLIAVRTVSTIRCFNIRLSFWFANTDTGKTMIAEFGENDKERLLLALILLLFFV